MSERIFYNPIRNELVIVDCHPHKIIYNLYMESELIVNYLGAALSPKFIYEPCFYVGEL